MLLVRAKHGRIPLRIRCRVFRVAGCILIQFGILVPLSVSLFLSVPLCSTALLLYVITKTKALITKTTALGTVNCFHCHSFSSQTDWICLTLCIFGANRWRSYHSPAFFYFLCQWVVINQTSQYIYCISSFVRFLIGKLCAVLFTHQFPWCTRHAVPAWRRQGCTGQSVNPNNPAPQRRTSSC